MLIHRREKGWCNRDILTSLQWIHIPQEESEIKDQSCFTEREKHACTAIRTCYFDEWWALA
jgi:hypothetical protein